MLQQKYKWIIDAQALSEGRSELQHVSDHVETVTVLQTMKKVQVKHNDLQPGHIMWQ